MVKKLIIEELSIVVVARNHNPTLLNPDFLKYNGIVPAAWELAEPPICTPPVSQVVYKSKISIMAQFGKLLFQEGIIENALKDAKIPKITVKYVETLPHVDYRAVGINPKGYVLAHSEKEAHEFVLNKLIAPGAWRSFRNKQPTVSTRFIYPINGGSINVTIENASLSLADNKQAPVVVFAANFHRDIHGKTSDEKVNGVKHIIGAWKTDVSTFSSLVEKTFLANKVKS